MVSKVTFSKYNAFTVDLKERCNSTNIINCKKVPFLNNNNNIDTYTLHTNMNFSCVEPKLLRKLQVKFKNGFIFADK